jgi:putative aldouronate transport system substrate-binding protein
MNRSLLKAVGVAAVLACLSGAVFGQAKPKITIANYQIEPTEANAEMLKIYGDKFGAEYVPVNIDNNKYHEILNLKLAAGEVPDFFYLKQADLLNIYVKQGVCAKIPMDMLQKYAPNMLKVLNDNAPGYLEMGKVKGALYAIPAVNAPNAFHIPLVYRTDWMKKVGVTKMPTTLDEFESLMYKFAKNDPDGNGKNDTYGLSQDGLNAVFGAFGLVPFDHNSKGAAGNDYWLLDSKGKVVNASIHPDVKKALALMAKWYKDGVLDPEFITGENQGGYWALSHAFIKGRIGFTTRANYYHWAMPGVYNDIAEDGTKSPCQPGANAKEIVAIDPKITIGLGPSLKGPNGKQGIKKYNMLMNFYCFGKQVEKDPAKMAKILAFMEENANPDFVVRNTIKNGIQDKYWKLLDADTETVTFIPPYDKDTGYVSRIGATLLRAELPFPMKGPREQWAYGLGYDKLGIDNLIQVGLPVATKYKTDLMKLRDEAYIQIITGAKSLSSYDDYVKTYLASGGTEAQKDAQAYYDEMSSK